MNESKFAVSRFENRNGVTSWRVSGWLRGVRIQKNFPTREEAAAERGKLRPDSVRVDTGEIYIEPAPNRMHGRTPANSGIAMHGTSAPP